MYPIELDDYPKLFDYVLTKQGLIYFHTLKRNYLLGKNMSLDECNKLRLMYVYYATANRNPQEVRRWQDVCITLDDKEIFEKDMYSSKEDLKNKLLVVKNPHYQSGLYRKHIQFVKETMNSK